VSNPVGVGDDDDDDDDYYFTVCLVRLHY